MAHIAGVLGRNPLLAIGAALLGGAALLAGTAPGSLGHLFSSDGFMPHGHCYLWLPGMVWLHALSDGLIALAYLSIPLTILGLVRRRKDLPFTRVFVLFAAFILSCGATHLIDVWTLWVPTYWLSGLLKALTAVVSIASAVVFARLLPRALAMPDRLQPCFTRAFTNPPISAGWT